MRRRALGRSGITVSALCLGTMTWGSQNDAAEAHAQIDIALDHGVDFLDTAEMYPTTPLAAETVGRTEEILGDWIAKSGRRGDIVLATKITGPNEGWCRDGEKITPDAVDRALEGSLRRLRTDVVDLYQLHWPNRGSYSFRRNWTYDPSGQDPAATLDEMEAVLGRLQTHVEAGRVRAVGLSNETAWGTAAWLRLAEANAGPRMQSIQNEYSLLHRLFDTDLAELSVHEEVGLLAYSPLAAGLLTGKYRGGAVPAGSRMSINGTLGGRRTARAEAAVEAYAAVAEAHGLDLVQMSLAFCLSRPFMASVIFGATDTDQLRRALGAAEIALSDEAQAAIAQTHREHPLPF